MPADQEDDGCGISEHFDRDDPAQCQRVLGFLLDLAATGSLFRVVGACSTLQNPRNGCIDPDVSHLALHPIAQMARSARRPRPLADWRAADGDVLWWQWPLTQPPWCGRPDEARWPGHHTHWTPIIQPEAPAAPDMDPSQPGTATAIPA